MSAQRPTHICAITTVVLVTVYLSLSLSDSIEKVHIQACKLFLTVPPHTNMTWCTENWEDSHCIFRLQLVVCNIGSVYNDSLYAFIPEKHTICYMDYEQEIAMQKLGFTMLNACCV